MGSKMALGSFCVTASFLVTLVTLKLANCYDANEVGFPLCIHMYIKAIKREVGPNRWWHIHITFIFGNYLSEIRQLL